MAGAAFGGVGWGLLAANTVGAGGDQAHLQAVVGPWLVGAAVISLLCLGPAAGRLRSCNACSTDPRQTRVNGDSMTPQCAA